MTEQQQQQKLAASSSSASSSLLAAATPEDDAKERKEAQEERVHVRDFTSPEGASSSAVAPPAPSNRGILNDADSIGESRPVKRHGRKGGLPMTRTISFSTPPDLPFPKRKSRFARRDTRETDSSDDGEDTLSEFSSDDGSSSEGGRRRKTRFRPHVPHRIRRLRKEKQETETEKEEDEEDEGHERPATDRVYRRTPVFSGTIAPFSIMLEIPGFTSKWYVRTGGQVYRPNPPVLDVGLALSLFFAVIANAAVLARFAERLSPRLATLIAVCGFLVHDVINIVALVVFAVIHNVDDGFTYSEAFWMTTAATGASLLCTTSLLLDYRNTKNFRSAGSGLTRKQSQLVMAIMAFLAYISISALIYSLVMQLQFLDAMYFMVESLATVGLGDVTPKGTAAKVLLFFIAPGGIVLLAVVIAFARQTILEELENAYKKNRALYKEKLAQRAQEQRQLKGVKHALKRRFTSVRRGVTRQFSIAPDVRPAPQADQAKAEAGTDKDEGATAAAGRVILEHGDGAPVPLYESPSGSCVDLSIDTSPAPASAPTHEQLTATPSIRSRHDTLHSIAPSDMQAMTEMEAELVAQRQEIDARFHHFTLTLSKRERAEFWAKIGLSALLFVGFWVVGAAVFSAIEGWTYFEGKRVLGVLLTKKEKRMETKADDKRIYRAGFYFSFVIFSSIGYGDLAPQTSSGRAFFIVWTLAGFGTLTVLLSILTVSVLCLLLLEQELTERNT